MSQTLAITRKQPGSTSMVDFARAAIVTGCGLALIFAGPVLPF